MFPTILFAFTDTQTDSIMASGGLVNGGAGDIAKVITEVMASAGVWIAGSTGNGANTYDEAMTGGLLAEDSALNDSIYNILVLSTGLFVSGPATSALPPASPVAFVGESSMGFRCRKDADVHRVTMVRVRDAYVPATTVCTYQDILRRLVKGSAPPIEQQAPSQAGQSLTVAVAPAPSKRLQVAL